MNLPESMNIPIFGNSSMAYQSGLSLQFPAKLTIIRQPKKRGYRFRYLSEGKTHGMLPGDPLDTDKEGSKVFPCIKLTGHRGKAKVVMTLVQDKPPYHIHPHTLLIEKVPVKGYHVIDIDGEVEKDLKNIAIQHVHKSNIIDKLVDRELQSRFVHDTAVSSFLQFRLSSSSSVVADFESFVDRLADKDPAMEFFDHKTKLRIPSQDVNLLTRLVKEKQKAINMSACRLCFITFLQDPQTGKFTKLLEPVYSGEIIDGKKKEGAQLKIIRLSHVAGKVGGGKEIWLLSDKVDAEDMEVHFWEKDERGEISWEALGEFNKTDVYKQALIVFKTPAYHDQTIDQPKTVFLQLRRKKDKNCVSDIHNFSYKPKHYDRYGLREKRRKLLPPEIYSESPKNYAPPSKRKAVEYNGNDADADVARWYPWEAQGVTAGTENPTLSDLIRGSGVPGAEAPALSSFQVPSFGGSSLQQFVMNASAFDKSGAAADDSETDSKEET